MAFARRTGGFVRRTVPVNGNVGRVFLCWDAMMEGWFVRDEAGAVVLVPSESGGDDRWNFKPPAEWAKRRFPRMDVILDTGRVD